MCIDPYIYATNVYPVRQVLEGLIPCPKSMMHVAWNWQSK